MMNRRGYILRAAISFGLAIASAVVGDLTSGDSSVLYGAAGGFVVYGLACTFNAIDTKQRNR